MHPLRLPDPANPPPTDTTFQATQVGNRLHGEHPETVWAHPVHHAMDDGSRPIQDESRCYQGVRRTGIPSCEA